MNKAKQLPSSREVLKVFQVHPGRMDTLAIAQDLIGIDAIVDPGTWNHPFYVRMCQDDADALYNLLREEMERADDTEIHLLSITPTLRN